MFRHVLCKLATETGRIQLSVRHAPVLRAVASASVPLRGFSDGKDEAPPPPVDAALLQLLVCPLSKQPLRYEPETNELINEELGIAYPITDGIPNMIPQEARLIRKDAPAEPTQG
ncbi:protein preY, mitochondrial [Myripristis murdjan]|uniref:Protein preY, mitochondrial n=1 Tax=Myripristis murdjan TaxID=586833 RepID=A0A667WXC8_9TELE|nr:protein preY, mitochondrial [Myripristis murdjan]